MTSSSYSRGELPIALQQRKLRATKTPTNKMPKVRRVFQMRRQFRSRNKWLADFRHTQTQPSSKTKVT
jgi:hypothetical protein